MTKNAALSAKYAKVDHNTIYNHRRADPEFAEQWDQAEAHAIEMLHARVFQRALEGDTEPIVYMGVIVGYVKKDDSKLQVELLRAHWREKFKTPGQTQVNIATKGDILVLTEEKRARIMEKRRQALLAMPTTHEGEDARRAALARDAECGDGTAQRQALSDAKGA